jgi:protein gp37
MPNVERKPANALAVLPKLEEAKRLLAECVRVDDAKQWYEVATAAQQYAQVHGLGLEAQNLAAEIRLRAEHRLGTLLAQNVNHRGGRPPRNGKPGPTVPPTLKDLGVRKHQSSQWQRVAAVPAEVFDRHLAEVQQAGKELTTDGVLEIAKGYRRTPLPVDEPGEGRREKYVILARWLGMSRAEQDRLLVDWPPGPAGMHFQDNASIEWARWAWNPVSGCRYNCPYCYARDIANLRYEQGFEPSLYPHRLTGPHRVKVPAGAEADIGLRNIFTCSMADLFGRWVPDRWIELVLETVRAAPQWNFLFLTKGPARMAEFAFPENAWVGTTVDCQARVANAERAFRKVKAAVKWLSCEPLLEPLRFKDLKAFQWIVLGGSSASTQTPEWHPPLSWIAALEGEAREAGLGIYEKDNLFRGRLRGYPGHPAEEPARAPEALRYLPEVEDNRAR